MSRFKTAFIFLAAAICVLAYRTEASAIAERPADRILTAPAAERATAQEPHSFRVAEEKATQDKVPQEQKSIRRQKCEILNECRRKFTVCYDEIYNNPKKSWETHENDCAIPYADCINKNFKTGEMWFIRMFYPFVLKCEKY